MAFGSPSAREKYFCQYELSRWSEIYSTDADINGQLSVIPHFSKKKKKKKNNNKKKNKQKKTKPQNIYIAHEKQRMQSLPLFELSNA